MTRSELRKPPTQRLAVLRHVAKGLTSEEIAEQMFLSRHTVKRHVALLRQETGAFNSAHLVAIGFRERWLP